MITQQARLNTDTNSEVRPAPSFISQARRQPLIVVGFVLLLIFVLAAMFAPVSYTHLDVYKRQYPH